jgi:hypothetical protein
MKLKQVMNTSSTTTHSDNSRKKTRRKVLVFPGVDKNYAVDEEDYLAITEMLSLSGVRGDQIERKAR